MHIVICGSMSASREMLEAQMKLQSLGHIVTLPEFTRDYAGMKTISKRHTESARNKERHDLIRGYFTVIKSGDAILIVNVRRKGINGYIGGNTFLEMGFAHVLGKPIYCLNPVAKMDYIDEILAMHPIILHNDFSRLFSKKALGRLEGGLKDFPLGTRVKVNFRGKWRGGVVVETCNDNDRAIVVKCDKPQHKNKRFYNGRGITVMAYMNTRRGIFLNLAKEIKK